MVNSLVVLAAFCPLVSAFSDSVPVIAWASHSSEALDNLPSRLLSTNVHTASLIEGILESDSACEHDAVILVEQSGLHASDLRTLPRTSSLTDFIASSLSTRQFPYVTSKQGLDLNAVAQTFASRCGSNLVNLTPGHGVTVSADPNRKLVACMSLPHLDGAAGARKDAMNEHATLLTNGISTLASLFPNHLVIYTGINPLSKRQSPDTNVFGPDLQHTTAPANTTMPSGGILKRYQLLTPGLLMSLLVVVFVLLPVVMLGINALASIQSPLRVEAPKGYSAREKKVQ